MVWIVVVVVVVVGGGGGRADFVFKAEAWPKD